MWCTEKCNVKFRSVLLPSCTVRKKIISGFDFFLSPEFFSQYDPKKLKFSSSSWIVQEIWMKYKKVLIVKFVFCLFLIEKDINVTAGSNENPQRYNSPVVTTVVLVFVTILIAGSILAYIVVFNVNGSTSDYIKSVWFGWAGSIFSRILLPVWITAFHHTDFRTFIFNTWHDLWLNNCLHNNKVQPILWCLGKKWKYWKVLITETDTDHHRHFQGVTQTRNQSVGLVVDYFHWMHAWFDQIICDGLYYRYNPYKIVQTPVVKNWSIHKNFCYQKTPNKSYVHSCQINVWFIENNAS